MGIDRRIDSSADMKKKINDGARHRSRIRKGDQVVVVAGAARGAHGRVLAVYPKTGRILVEGVNVVRRAYRKGVNPSFPNGGIHEKTLPIAISNVMLLDPKAGVPTRITVAYEQQRDGTVRRVRYAKVSGQAIKD